jgi:hypothetical protein
MQPADVHVLGNGVQEMRFVPGLDPEFDSRICTRTCALDDDRAAVVPK